MTHSSAKLIAQNTMIAALYITLNLINPIASGIFQFRIATLLMAIPFFFPSMSYGLVVGVVLSNLMSGFGPIDALGGFTIQCLSLFVYNRLLSNAYIKSLCYALTAGIIVSTVIFYVAKIPFETNAFAISIFSIFLSNALIAILGVILVSHALKPILNKYID